MPTHGPVGSFPLHDKIVLVTGGGSGISFRFVELAISFGAKGIVVVDLRLSPEAEAFVSANGSRVVFQKTDVTDWKQLRSLFTLSKDRFGDVPDVYMLGAGLFESPGRNYWDDVADEEDGKYLEIDVNVGHVIKFTRLAMRACLGVGKKGVVCSLASTAGLTGVYTSPLYCATKHAVVGFTKSMKLADEHEGLKICTVCPGIVETPLWDEAKRAQFSLSKNNDILTTDDVAKTIIAVVEDGQTYGGGAVVELVKADAEVYTRVVPEWNADPPRPNAFTKLLQAESSAVEAMLGPVVKRTADERGSQWP